MEKERDKGGEKENQETGKVILRSARHLSCSGVRARQSCALSALPNQEDKLDLFRQRHTSQICFCGQENWGTGCFARLPENTQMDIPSILVLPHRCLFQDWQHWHTPTTSYQHSYPDCTLTSPIQYHWRQDTGKNASSQSSSRATLGSSSLQDHSKADLFVQLAWNQKNLFNFQRLRGFVVFQTYIIADRHEQHPKKKDCLMLF